MVGGIGTEKKVKLGGGSLNGGRRWEEGREGKEGRSGRWRYH